MLSYLHAYHAGNFADVHKHVALVWLLRALARKEAAFTCLDTHAGRGDYDLESPEGARNAEWRDGIGRLYEVATAPAPVLDYLECVRRLDPDGGGRRYPGSPALAVSLLREQDRAVLMELHPAEWRALRRRFRGDPRVGVHRRNGLEGLVALVPPSERRGLVLVDPSYERAGEPEAVARALVAAHRRWRGGVYLVWYPLLPAARHRALLDALAASGMRDVLGSELRVRAPAGRHGLYGSGLLLVNPPWHADEMLDETGAFLAECLGEEGARHDLRRPTGTASSR